MTNDENKAIVRRVFEEVWNWGNLGLIDDLFAPDFVRHGAPADRPRGPEGERRHRAAFRAALPDLVIVAEDMIAEGDRVAVRYTWQGTHLGAWMGLPPTGKRLTMSGIAIHRIVAGQVQELWVVGDELGLMRQLGIVSAPLDARSHEEEPR